MTVRAKSKKIQKNRGKSAKAKAVRQSPAQPVILDAGSLEALGLGSADTLRQQLDYGLSFLASCEAMLRESRVDPTKPIFGAAAIMRANVSTALAIAPAARGETRHRSISETIPPPDGKREEMKTAAQSQLRTAQARVRIAQRMEELVAQSIRARTGESTERDRVAELLASDQKDVERLKKSIAELE